MDVALDAEVRPDLPNAKILQRHTVQSRRSREGDASFAGNFRRIEQDEFVNEARGECRSVERRSSL